MSDSNSSDGFEGIIGLLGGIYIVISQIMTIVFWIQYVKTDNAIIAALVDPILAEIKGLLWPFFI